MPIYKGSGVALVTPMNEDYSVNYEKLAELVEYHIQNGTDAIVAVGTTGEASTLSEEEHMNVVQKTLEFAKGRIPVIAGTGSNSTETAIQITKRAQHDGADAALIVSPYYNKATQKGLIKHFSAIAKECSLPIILYNIPGRTGVNIQPETIAELMKINKNIVGVKDSTGDFSQIAKLAYLTDGKAEMYSGEDGMVLPLLSLGGIGVISVMANIIPKDTHDMVTSFLNGDIKKAIDIQTKVNPLVDALFCEVNPIPIKHAMNILGMEVGPLRLPLCEMEEQNIEKLKATMKEYGVL